MKVMVIGANGKIGRVLVDALREAGHETVGVTRKFLDLSALPMDIPGAIGTADVVYLCAAMTRFIDCEADEQAYSVNVDAPAEIARQMAPARVVYCSSEAVERALHTNYGMHKALAEISLRTVCQPVVARLSKVDPDTMEDACDFLVRMATAAPGVYRWKAGACA